MDRIDFDDLINESGILTGISNLIKATTKYGDTSVATNDRIKKSLSELSDELGNYKSRLESLDGSNRTEKYKQLASSVDDVSQAYRNQKKTLEQNQALFDTNSKAVDQMQGRLEQLRKEYDSLDLSRKQDVKRSKEIQREMSQTTRAVNVLTNETQKATRAVRIAEGSYNALSKETADLKAQLKNLPNAFDASTGAINKNNKAAVEMQQIIERNEKALRKADSQMGNYSRNVGNYGSAFSGFGKNILASTGQLIGISSAFEAITMAIKVTSDMERLDAGLKAVSRDTDDFNRSQQFLLSTSDELGLRYDSLVKSFKLLKAATKDTSLEGAETEHIFHAVTEAGARLGLTVEDTEGALLALTQMISKGKISAEELRGQLGERVPAAMAIMAKATGVTEIELNKMMEKGQLMAVDVLPKFATELDKIYGGDSQEKINTMSAGWNRMTNSAQQFIAAFNENKKVSGFFGTIQTGIAGVLNDLTTLVKSNQWGLFMSYLTGGAAVGSTVAGAIRAGEAMAAQNEQKFRGLASDDRQKLVNQADEKRVKIQKELNALLDKSPTADVTAKELELQKQLNSAQRQYNFLVKTNNDQVTQEARTSAAKAKEKKQQDVLKAEEADKARKKAQVALDKATQDALGKSQSRTGERLAGLSSDRQDGVVSEQAYIEQRLKVTLDGLNERQAILEKAGKKETDDYINIQKEKLKADTEYKRAQLQLDLKGNKGTTDRALAGLDRERGEDGLDDITYTDRRHDIVVAGIERERALLIEAGQEKTDLFKATETALNDEQADYINKRLIAVKKAWKDEIAATKEGLTEIDRETGADYDKRLTKITEYYNGLRNQVELDQASGKTNSYDAKQQLHIIDLNQLQAEITAYREVIANSKQLTSSLIQDRIDKLQNYIAYSGASEKELVEKRREIADLEKLQRESDAKDQMKLDKKVADNAIEQSDREAENKKRNAEKEKEMRQRLGEIYMEIGRTVVDGLFAVQQQETQNRITELNARQEAEMALVGDNEGAKADIQKKYDNERKQLQRQQDRANREKALFDVAINTATAVMKTFAEFGFPLGIPLAAAQAALGLVQAGVIMATPLPAYFDGKNFDGVDKDNYSGPATISEKGRELWKHEGRWNLVESPSVVNVGRNDVIVPNWLTERLLSDDRAFEANQMLNRLSAGQMASQQLVADRERHETFRMYKALNAGGASADALGRAVANAIAKNPFWTFTADNRGFNVYQQQANARIAQQRNKHQLGKKG